MNEKALIKKGAFASTTKFGCVYVSMYRTIDCSSMQHSLAPSSTFYAHATQHPTRTDPSIHTEPTQKTYVTRETGRRSAW